MLYAWRPRAVTVYNHPEVDRIWITQGIARGSFKDHSLSTPGWLCLVDVLVNQIAVPQVELSVKKYLVDEYTY